MLLLLLLLLVSTTQQSGLKILNTPGFSVHPEPCAVTCAGVTSAGWQDSVKFPGRVNLEVDIRQCGFTSLPIINLSVKSSGGFHKTINVMNLSMDYFIVYTNQGMSADYAEYSGWQLNWTAVGFNC